MESRHGFCLAIETYLDLAQRDNSFLHRGTQLQFKSSLYQCFQEFQSNYHAILGFLACGKGSEEAQEEVGEGQTGKENSGETSAAAAVANRTTERNVWHLSTQTLFLAERDRRCGSFLLENANFRQQTGGQPQDFSSQAVLFFQQAAEKSVKALWLLHSNNAENLLNSVRKSTRGKEKSYYISHDLVVLAKGLMRGNFFNRFSIFLFTHCFQMSQTLQP